MLSDFSVSPSLSLLQWRSQDFSTGGGSGGSAEGSVGREDFFLTSCIKITCFCTLNVIVGYE